MSSSTTVIFNTVAPQNINPPRYHNISQTASTEAPKQFTYFNGTRDGCFKTVMTEPLPQHIQSLSLLRNTVS